MKRLKLKRMVQLLMAGLLAVAIGVLIWWYYPPAALEAWKAGPPPAKWSSLEYLEQVWQWEGQDRTVQVSYVPLDQISLQMQMATVAAEDIGFFYHSGIDLTAVQEAVGEWLGGKRLRGASTITQQLAKNLFLTHRRSLFRKLREARLAYWMEKELGKRRILELYLNVLELGDGVLGAEAGARYYFGVSANRLGRDRAASLAATIPSPLHDNPISRTRAWENRRRAVLDRLERFDWLPRRLLGLHDEEAAARLATAAASSFDSMSSAPDTIATVPDTTTAPDRATVSERLPRIPPDPDRAPGW
jgi:monofunctional biosynthetic peptidoglycan transglycosylase